MAVFSAGQYTNLAELLEQLVPLYVEKGSDESVTSSTTLQNDDELFIAGIPPGTWELSGELWALGTSAAAQDVKYSFAFPTGTISWSGIGLEETWASGAGLKDVAAGGYVNISSSPTSSAAFGCVTGGNIPTQIKGHLVSTAAGTLQLQWAQSTVSGTATTLKAGSWLALRKLVIA